MTTFSDWIARVIQIGQSRGLSVSLTYQSPTHITFRWDGVYRHGVAGAGAEMIQLTTPEQFTWLWYDSPHEAESGPKWERRGRYAPRVPAMGVSAALGVLFL